MTGHQAMGDDVSETIYKPVPVAAAVAVADQCEKDVVVILAIDRKHGLTHTTTYGRTAEDKSEAAHLGDYLTKAIGSDLNQAVSFEDFRSEETAAKNAMLSRSAIKLLQDVHKAIRNQSPAERRRTLEADLRDRIRDLLTAEGLLPVK